MNALPSFRIGTAGWATPRQVRERFPDRGTGLQRYAARLACAEINSTFYRSHRRTTYERWASDTPDGFRFAVKAPKTVTHERRLQEAGDLFLAFLDETAALAEKRGPVLVQLPGTLAFDQEVAEAFFTGVRRSYAGPLACEPRHAGWFTADAGALLTTFDVARVAADPAVVPEAAEPGGWSGLIYRRLHGSPRLYITPYPAEALDALATRIAGETPPTWCIFDNTMSGAATDNALDLQSRLQG